MVRTPPFHGGNMGSNPVGITNTKKASFMEAFFVLVTIPTGSSKPYYLGNYGLEDKNNRCSGCFYRKRRSLIIFERRCKSPKQILINE